MITNYQSFIIDREILEEVNQWIQIHDSINESSVDLKDRIRSFVEKVLRKAKSNGDISKALDKILSVASKKRTLLATIVAVLLMDVGVRGSLVQGSLLRSGSDLTVEEVLKEETKGQLPEFMKAISDRESSNDWKIINKYGYVGKYQFGNIALKDCGYDFTTKDFKNNPNIFPAAEQDRAMIKLLKNNKRYLGKYIEKYVGKTIAGVKITKSGLLAAAHLVGAKKIKRFLRSNGSYIPMDKNKTKCTEYLKKFGGYEISI